MADSDSVWQGGEMARTFLLTGTRPERETQANFLRDEGFTIGQEVEGFPGVVGSEEDFVRAVTLLVERRIVEYPYYADVLQARK
jgi:hypothetical protein